jgi:hypothetical protein
MKKKMKQTSNASGRAPVKLSAGAYKAVTEVAKRFGTARSTIVDAMVTVSMVIERKTLNAVVTRWKKEGRI